MKRLLINLTLLSISIFLLYGCSEQLPKAGVDFGHPLERYSERPKLLTFGLHVTPNPEENPIDPPERFTGYHAALDLEIFEDEKDKDVPVFAICDGEILEARTAEGYGGVLVHSCSLKGQDATVLYGHMDPASFTRKPGEKIKKNEKLGVLAAAKTEGSGFTRKHLHLGIHKGKEIEMAGYVETKEALDAFLDPQEIL